MRMRSQATVSRADVTRPRPSLFLLHAISIANLKREEEDSKWLIFVVMSDIETQGPESETGFKPLENREVQVG